MILNKGVEDFLDGLEASRLDPGIRAVLDKAYVEVMAEDYERELDKTELFIRRLDGISSELWPEHRMRLLEKERSFRAKQWNSRLTTTIKRDYIYPEKENFREETG